MESWDGGEEKKRTVGRAKRQEVDLRKALRFWLYGGRSGRRLGGYR